MLLVVVATKFAFGGWIVILLIPVFVWTFHIIEHRYVTVAEQLSLDGLSAEKWTDLASSGRYKVIGPVSGMHRGTLAALRFARSLSTDVTAVVVDVVPRITARVRDRWSVWGGDVPLVVLQSPFRSVIEPLLAYLDEMDRRDPERGLATGVLPEFVPARWWHHLLHDQTALLIKTVLTYRRQQTGRDRVIIDVPYHLRR